MLHIKLKSDKVFYTTIKCLHHIFEEIPPEQTNASWFNHPLLDMGKHSLEILTAELPSVQQSLLRLVLVLSPLSAARYSTESSWHTCLLFHGEGD